MERVGGDEKVITEMTAENFPNLEIWPKKKKKKRINTIDFLL